MVVFWLGVRWMRTVLYVPDFSFRYPQHDDGESFITLVFTKYFLIYRQFHITALASSFIIDPPSQYSRPSSRSFVRGAFVPTASIWRVLPYSESIQIQTHWKNARWRRNKINGTILAVRVASPDAVLLFRIFDRIMAATCAWTKTIPVRQE